MTIAARLDDIGKPAWMALMIAGFVVWWPIGRVTLGFLIGSGRIMGCWTQRRHDRWQRRGQEGMERMQQGVRRGGAQRAGGERRGSLGIGARIGLVRPGPPGLERQRRL